MHCSSISFSVSSLVLICTSMYNWLLSYRLLGNSRNNIALSMHKTWVKISATKSHKTKFCECIGAC